MGNQNSRTKSQESNKEDDIENMKFENVVSYVAAKYITQANFQDLKNLHNPDYCNKLVILTSKAIKHFLNEKNIDYLDQKTKSGNEINKMANADILYLDKDNLDRLDVSSQVRKKRMCIGLAKFYVKIAHIFAAIAMTINPRYTYIDENGVEQTVSFEQRSNIPKGREIKTKYNNLCSARINAIKPRQNTENGIVLKAKNCDMNKKRSNMVDDVQVPTSSTETKNLYDEPGIPELETLYYDDYNFSDGKYVGVTDEGKDVYLNDLEKFYIAFTGGECFPNKCGVIIENIDNNIDEMTIGQFFSRQIGEVIFVEKQADGVYIKFKDPKNRDKLLKKKNFKFMNSPVSIKKWEITKFSEIPLKDFHNQELCSDITSPWKKSYSGNANDKLFIQYAEHIKNMITKSQKLEKSLLNIVKELFSFWVDPQKKEKALTINPELTKKRLDELTAQTRDTILSLYIGCEEDFQKGLQLFEGIVKSKMIETSQRRIKQFEKKADELNEIPVEAPQVMSAAPAAGGGKKKRRKSRKKR